MNTPSTHTQVGVGGLAFIAGILATILTAYAVFTRRGRKTDDPRPLYEGWDDSLGI